MKGHAIVTGATAKGRAVKEGRKLSLRRLSVYAGASLGALVLATAVLIFASGRAILNHFGKAKAERALAEAYPGYALRIGELEYSAVANRLVAGPVTLSAPDMTLKVGRISLTGVCWARLLWGSAAPADILAKATLDATNLNVEFPEARYGIRCERLRASVPGSELIAEGTELRPLVEDEVFLAALDFRATRYHVVVPACRVLGLAYRELLQGKSYRASSVHVLQPSFDALVSRDKPVEPVGTRPLMLHEVLAAIQQPVQLDSLSITNGHVTYCERVIAGADPGVLTFAAVNVSATGIANRGEAPAAIVLLAQGDLMNTGVFKMRMMIPVASPDLTLHYSGSLGAMDLTRLDAFLDIAEHTRIKTGDGQEMAFEIDVSAGQARGRVRAIYGNLAIAFLNKETGSEKGIDHRVGSLLANVLKFRNANAPDAAGAMKMGEVSYARKPEDTFLQFAWFALRTGVLDVISH